MPEDSQGAGALQENPQSTEGQPQGAGAPPQPTTPPETPPEPPKPDSANQLIKQFVKERGITVEELINEYSDLKTATQSERERLENERDTLKTQADNAFKELREMRARVALQDAVNGLNTIDPATVMDLALPKLDYDDDGNPANIDDVLETLKTTRPKLFPAAAGSGDGGKGGTPVSAKKDINAALREMARTAY